jgi:NAD(P)-dependent dehydrogenase (short-subunit alcohol dehydrogenase family)
LAAAGASVVIVDIVDAGTLAQEIESDTGSRALAIIADVSDEGSVKTLIAQAVATFGRIDVLVNNAAIASVLKHADPTEIDVELWDRVMAVNVRGPFLTCKHAAKVMIGQGGGKIINISSGVAYKGARGVAHYVTSKAAVLGLTRALARDLGPHNICVNTIAPGLIMSDSLIANYPDLASMRQQAAAARSLKREGRPEDLLGTLIFLASSDSDFISGQTIVLDGGTLTL